MPWLLLPPPGRARGCRSGVGLPRRRVRRADSPRPRSQALFSPAWAAWRVLRGAPGARKIRAPAPGVHMVPPRLRGCGEWSAHAPRRLPAPTRVGALEAPGGRGSARMGLSQWWHTGPGSPRPPGAGRARSRQDMGRARCGQGMVQAGHEGGRVRCRQDMEQAEHGAGRARSRKSPEPLGTSRAGHGAGRTRSRQGMVQAEPGAPRQVQGSGRRAVPASGQAWD